MANEFIARNGVIALANTSISGSLNVLSAVSASIFTGSFIGTLTGTSSFSTSGSQAISASFAATASFIQASGVVGLNLSQIATGSVTASVSDGSGSFTIVSGSSKLLLLSSSGDLYVGPIVGGIQNNSIILPAEGTTNSVKSFVNLRLEADANNSNSALYSQIQFYTDGVQRALIDDTGSMAIGLTGPLAKLHVSSSTGAQFLVGNNNLFVSSSGNVGIGTTSPSSKLELRGNRSATKDSLLLLSKFDYGTTTFYQNYIVCHLIDPHSCLP